MKKTFFIHFILMGLALSLLPQNLWAQSEDRPGAVRPSAPAEEGLEPAISNSLSTALKIVHVDSRAIEEGSAGKGCAGEREVEATSLKVTKIDRSESESSLQFILKDILASGCAPEKTAFVFDVDETVLVIKDTAKAIRQSPELINEMQKLGLTTFALTIRDAVPLNFRNFILSEERAGRAETAKQYLYGQSNFIKEDIGSAGIVLKDGLKLLAGASGFYDHDGSESGEGFFMIDKGLEGEPFDMSSGKHLAGALYYSNGIVMASHRSKGETLLRFLDKKKLADHFECIFFADDELDNIKDMSFSLGKTKGKRAFIYQMPKP